MEDIHVFNEKITEFCIKTQGVNGFTYEQKKEILKQLFEIPSETQFESIELKEGEAKVKNFYILLKNFKNVENVINTTVSGFGFATENIYLIIALGVQFLYHLNKWSIKNLTEDDALILHCIKEMESNSFSIDELLKSCVQKNMALNKDELLKKLIDFSDLKILRIKDDMIFLLERFK